jgi:hypothetical protein
LRAEFVSRWAGEEASIADARQQMTARFAKPDWRFAVGQPDDRNTRNSRGLETKSVI